MAKSGIKINGSVLVSCGKVVAVGAEVGGVEGWGGVSGQEALDSIVSAGGVVHIDFAILASRCEVATIPAVTARVERVGEGVGNNGVVADHISGIEVAIRVGGD